MCNRVKETADIKLSNNYFAIVCCQSHPHKDKIIPGSIRIRVDISRHLRGPLLPLRVSIGRKGIFCQGNLKTEASYRKGLGKNRRIADKRKGRPNWNGDFQNQTKHFNEQQPPD